MDNGAIPSSAKLFLLYLKIKIIYIWIDSVKLVVLCCFQAVLVHTQETIRVRYFMDLLMVNRRPIMLVGSAGTGKTVLVGDKFAALDPDNFMVTNVPFNYYTTSAMLQAVLDKPLEKKAGRNYGPPGTKKLIYFIDDMNMPMVSNAGAPKCQDLIGALGK